MVLEIQHKDRLLADPGAVEDVLAVENDVVPLNGANIVEQRDLDFAVLRLAPLHYP